MVNEWLRAIGLHQADQEHVLDADVCDVIHTTKNVINHLWSGCCDPVSLPGLLLMDIQDVEE